MKQSSKSSARKLSRKAETAVLTLCFLIMLTLFFASLLVGASGISIEDALKWMLGGHGGGKIHSIMLYIRLPRSIAIIACGSALALSGLLLQSALHNPLASAGTIGVSSGAGMFAVLSSALFPGVFMARPALAFAGAMFAALIVFGISQKAGASKSTIIMSGVAVGSLLSAGTDIIVTLRPESVMDRTAFFIGGFSHVTMKPLTFVIPPILFGIIGAVLLSSHMNVLSLGDEVAASLGVHIKRCRFLIIMCAALLAASAVCIGGLLGFVGLIVPHAARSLVGYNYKLLVPFVAFLGGGLVAFCDILARLLFSPHELPVGILLSLLGAPFFLFLVLRRRRIVI